jgi:hypothetical protein
MERTRWNKLEVIAPVMDFDETVPWWSRENRQLLPNDARASAGFGSLDNDASASRVYIRRMIMSFGTIARSYIRLL